MCNDLDEQMINSRTFHRLIVGSIRSATKTIIVLAELYEEAAVPSSAIVTPIIVSGKQCMKITYPTVTM